MSYKQLFSGAFLLAVSSLVSRALGVWRDHALATTFGASENLDAYYAAFRIPDLIYALLIVSSLSAVILPLFQDYKEQGNMKKAWDFLSGTANTLALLFSVLSLTIIIFAPYIVPWYTYDFTKEQQEITVSMLRIMMISPLFFMLSSFMITVENAYHQFLGQSLAPIFYNLMILIGIYYFTPIFKMQGLAFGVVLGSFFQMLIQIPFFLSLKGNWRPILLPLSERMKVIKLALPRILAVSSTQIALTIDVIIASGLTVGSLSIFQLASNIQSLPFGVIAISLSIQAFSHLTALSAQKNHTAFTHELQSFIRATLFWMLPALIGLYVLAPSIVAFLFYYGSFSQSALEGTTQVLRYLLIALLAQSFIPLLSRAFFAVHKTSETLIFSLIGCITNIAGSLIFSRYFGVAGIALGAILGSFVQSTLLFWKAYSLFGNFFDTKNIVKILISAGILVGILIFIVPFMAGLPSIFTILTISIVGALSYLGMAKLLQIPIK